MRRIFALTAVAAVVSIVAACSRSHVVESFVPLPDRELAVVHSEAQSFLVDTIFPDLVRPYSMAFLPDGSILIAERRGHLLVVRNGEIAERLVGGNVPEELRDLALHPDYDENGWIYISYYVEQTAEEGARTVVMRARLEGNRLVDDEVIYSAGPFRAGANFFGSRIVFDNDGYLYVTVGGRTMWDAPRDRPRDVARLDAQDLSIPGGKTMRLFDDGSIPPDNPFLNTPGALPEIYTYGHRQHQGAALNPWTGEIWSTEHGEMGGDELNVLKRGSNYGWPLATFSLNYDSTHLADPYGEGLEPPIHYWTPALNPSGLDFVTSDRYPGWKGNLLVAGLRRQALYRSVLEGDSVVYEEALLDGIGRLRSVNVAPDGFIYILSESEEEDRSTPGMLLRLIPVDSSIDRYR